MPPGRIRTRIPTVSEQPQTGALDRTATSNDIPALITKRFVAVLVLVHFPV